MNERKISRLLKPQKKRLYILLMLGLISLFLYYGADELYDWSEELSESEDTTSYHELIINNGDEAGAYTKVQIAFFQIFAETDTGENYYYIQDTDRYLYIARLSDDTADKIIEYFNENPGVAYYELYGYLYTIPANIESLAISQINTAFDESMIVLNTDEDFAYYFSYTYISEKTFTQREMKSMFINLSYVVDIVLGGVFFSYIYYLISYYKIRNKNDLSMIRYELEKHTAVFYKKEKVYLTDKFVIVNKNQLMIFNYRELHSVNYIYSEYGHIYLTFAKNEGKVKRVSYSKKREFNITVIVEEINEKIHEMNGEYI